LFGKFQYININKNISKNRSIQSIGDFDYEKDQKSNRQKSMDFAAREAEKKKEELKKRLEKTQKHAKTKQEFLKICEKTDFLQQSEISKDKKKKMQEELENIRKNQKCMNSGFSWQEIESFESKDIKSMISIDEDLEDEEKINKLLFSNVLKPKTKPKQKKDKICFNLCTERQFSSLKCSLF